MARRSSRSEPTSDFGDDGGFIEAEFAAGSFDTEESVRELTPEELDAKLRGASQKAYKAATVAANDGGFLARVEGTPDELRRVVVVCRGRAQRREVLQEYACEVTEAPIEILFAEEVLASEALLERLHAAVCRANRWGLDTPVEEVCERLEAEPAPG